MLFRQALLFEYGLEHLQLTIAEPDQSQYEAKDSAVSLCAYVCVQRLHHTEDLIKWWSFWACSTQHHIRHQGNSPPPQYTFHGSSLSPFLCLETSQYIWLNWWTGLSAKLISFRAHSSHGDHLISASKPSAPNINLAWLTYREGALAHTHELYTSIPLRSIWLQFFFF